jgi:S1-C subfamily serine protease
MKDEDNDLAVIKISDEQFKPMFGGIDYAFSSSHSFELGGNAFTLGFPLALAGMGSGEVKFSDGKISARTGYNGALNSFQTSIPVQPGNSGGPVFNQNGELIGIINSKIAKADNVSYAIKYNFLINLLQSLPENVNLPSNNKLATYSLEEKIKNVKKYIVLIKIK